MVPGIKRKAGYGCQKRQKQNNIGHVEQHPLLYTFQRVAIIKGRDWIGH